jgi:RNA polymerase sigma-70 factor (ECF subfamily)
MKEKEILILYYEKQLPYDQIAKYLNISVLNCRTRLFRAKAHYKELINRERYLLWLCNK